MDIRQGKVLVYLFGSLGDNIASIPALRAVRRHFGDSEVVVLENVQSAMPVSASEVLPSELVDRYLSYSSDRRGFGRLGEFWRLRQMLRSERFDAVVYLAISERPEMSVKRDRYFFRLCGIRRTYGFHAFRNEELYPRDTNGTPAPTTSEASRRMARLALDGIATDAARDLALPLISASEADAEAARRWLSGHRSDSTSRLVAIAPGCKTLSNQWPLDRFAEIGRRLLRLGQTEIVIVGGRGDRELSARLIEEWRSGMNAAGEFSVAGSAAVLSLCNFYVGLDTGTTHLAAAVGTPVFAIYGQRNNRGQWFPLGDRYVTIGHSVSCAGCRQQICPLPEHPCVRLLEVDTVWNELTTFADEVAGRSGHRWPRNIVV